MNPRMNRRAFLKASSAASLLPLWPRGLPASLPEGWLAGSAMRRVRPSAPGWPSKEAWNRLNDAVGGNLIPVDSPITACLSSLESPDCKTLFANVKNPYYIGDSPGVTQTLGWVGAWTTKPSVYAVAARNADDIAAAVNFARDHNLRLVVKGGGHSYQGTSNAPDSLLIWTRHMHDVTLQDNFVPQGCESSQAPQRAVTVGAGTIGLQAYDAVTTKAGAYVQGGGCTTVGLAGLVQSGGFGSFSKHYGTAASGLLEAEVVTADGKIRIANACSNPDLFWALKGGGGGSFGVISKMTLRVRDLPEFFGSANFTIKAASDDAYRRLIREFVSFYREHLFNDHWGEQAHINSDNSLGISMVFHALDTEQAKQTWKPFLDWVKGSSHDYSMEGHLTIGSIPARHFWDVQWWKEHWTEVAFPNQNGSRLTGLLDYALLHLMQQPVLKFDDRADAGPNHAWWAGDGGQVAWFIWGYESLWLPASLLEDNSQPRLADALYASSRYSTVELHFNKGLAGAPAEAIEAARNTAMNPAVCDAFALAIVGDGQGPAYPGIPGHEPDVVKGRAAADRVHRCMNELRAVAANGGAYVSESNFFESDFQHSYWGSNYARLAAIKRKYDPNGLFFVHNGVGSEEWSPDGFTRL
jgi:FAD/FMN-containing dehydrogenase